MQQILEKIIEGSKIDSFKNPLIKTQFHQLLIRLKEKCLAASPNNADDETTRLNLSQHIESGLDDVRKSKPPYDNYEDRELTYNYLYELVALCKPRVEPVLTVDRWSEHAIRIEQAIACQNPQFLDTLKKIGVSVSDGNTTGTGPTCFVSYAWPLISKSHEFWVQSFLYTLLQHLELAGIRVELDIAYSRWGGNPITFMNKITDANYVIAIGTESLKVKSDLGIGMVCFELNLIRDKHNAWSKTLKNTLDKTYSPIIPMLLSGTYETSFPADFRVYKAIEGFVESGIPDQARKSYGTILELLINNLYRTRNQFSDLWDALRQSQAVEMLGLPKDSVLQHVHDERVSYEHARQEYEKRCREILEREKSALVSCTPYFTDHLFVNPHDPAHYLSHKIQKLREKALADEESKRELALYVPLQSIREGSDTTIHDLQSRVQSFLSSSQKLLLILGSGGSGKSTFNRFLECELWNQYTPGQPLPIFISLSTLENPKTNLIQEHLERLGFTKLEINLLRSHPILFILDGYDEMRRAINLYATNHLENWHAHVIVTCRTEYLQQELNGEYERHFYPYQNDRPHRERFDKLSIVPFTENQIEQYIRSYLEICKGDLRSEPEWHQVKTYLNYMKMISGLWQLITTPFMLMITMKVMPEIVSDFVGIENDTERCQMTGARLYDAFMKNWFQREEDKLIQAGKAPEDGRVDIKESFDSFCQKLALAMRESGDISLVTFPAPRSQTSSQRQNWDYFFGTKANELALRAAPLKNMSHQSKIQKWGFLHDNLRIYFYTKSMSQQMELQTDGVPTPVNDSIQQRNVPVDHGLAASVYATTQRGLFSAASQVSSGIDQSTDSQSRSLVLNPLQGGR